MEHPVPLRSPAAGGIAAAAAVALGAWALSSTTFYVTQREWQTATTAWWIAHLGVGPGVAPCPLMGPPWRIPMEWPLFQWLAATLTRLSIPLEVAGRMVALASAAAVVWLASVIGGRFGLDRDLRWIVAALTATSPLMVAYGLSFTIETLALALALGHLAAFLLWLERPRWLWLVLSIISGLLAAPVKATTWAPVAAVLGLAALLWVHRRRSRAVRALSGAAVVLVPALVAGLFWTATADQVKASNPLTSELGSAALAWWNFGTWEQRLSPAAWCAYGLRWVVLALGPGAAMVLAWALVSALRRRVFPLDRAALAVVVVGVVAGPAVFANLHLVHDYYALPGLVFTMVAVALVSASVRLPRALVATALAANLAAGAAFLLAKQANYADPLVEGVVARIGALPEPGPVVVFGAYLNAEIPYLAERRALQTRIDTPGDPGLTEVLEQLPQPAAIVTLESRYDQVARHTAARFGLQHETRLAPGVRLFAARSANLPPIRLDAVLAARWRGFEMVRPQHGPKVLWPTGPDAAPGVGVVARGNTYLFDIRRGFRVVHRRWDPRAR